MDLAGRLVTSKKIRLERCGKLLVAMPLARTPKLMKSRALAHDERALVTRASGPKRKRS